MLGTIDDVIATKRVFGPSEATAHVTGGGPSTDDDVSITNDGCRLDSADAVIQFFAELRREQAEVDQTS